MMHIIDINYLLIMFFRKITLATSFALCALVATPTAANANSLDQAFGEVQIQLVQAIALRDQDQITQLFQVFLELLALQSNDFGSLNSSDGDIEIETDDDVDRITSRSAELRGEIDFNRGADRAYVWFEYGEDRDELDLETSREYIDEDDDEEFEMRINDLDRGERYYFRAVAEDRDTDELYYGDIESFRTSGSGSSNRDDEPDVETEEVSDIDEDSAEINGSVDMNDFRNGSVFFVWGEDEDEIEEVEDEEQYSDVQERGDDLQKQRVDSDLDGQDDYSLDIRNLDDDTEIFYALCVAYEDDDNDDVIDCGSVEEFETDRD